MEPGSLIRELRKSKNMTLQNLAEDIISYSALASFERNKTMVSFESLLLLLQRLNVNINEFIYQVDPTPCEYLVLFQKMNALIGSEDIIGFKMLITGLVSEANQSIDLQKKLNLIMAKSIGNQFLQLPAPTQVEIEFFQEYLFSAQKINHYELTLFGNCYLFFPESFILSICSKIISQTKNPTFSRNNRDSFRVIINCSLYFLEQNKLKNAKYLLNILSEEVPQSYVYEHFYLETLAIIYRKKKRSSFVFEEAKQLHATLLQIHCTELASAIEKLFVQFDIFE